MSMYKLRSIILAVAAVVLTTSFAQAGDHAAWPSDWNNWSDPALWVTVGNPGNAHDTQVMNDRTTGYGSVCYTYQIGKYEVTAGQYTTFLNAVATTSDPMGCTTAQCGQAPMAAKSSGAGLPAATRTAWHRAMQTGR